MRIERDLRSAVIVGAGLVASTAALVVIVGRLLSSAAPRIGDDYQYFMPYLLAGAAWIKQSGWLAIPYFTPDFCGGIPWLANPQSMFYSAPQVLTVWLGDPVAAVRWTSLLFATLGGAAMYGLLRQRFAASPHAAGLGFVLFQLNGFFLFRMGVGHLTYHVFALLPILCWCTLVDQGAERTSGSRSMLASEIGAGIGGAAVLAVIVYGGALNYVIPAVLGAAAVIFLAQTRTGWSARPWFILASACLWAIALSALKLVPAALFAAGYPRTLLDHFLFRDPIRLLAVLARSMFAPELQPVATAISDQAAVGQHELEFGVSVVVPILMIAALLDARRGGLSRPRHSGPWLGLAAVLIIPILGTFGGESWGHLLLRVPIINSNTMLIRWWSIYVVILIVAAALCFDRNFAKGRSRELAFAICVVIAAAQLTARDLTYYRTDVLFKLYDAGPVATASRALWTSESAPPDIVRLGARVPGAADPLLVGTSTLPCYEPLFGYWQEFFPAHSLNAGPIDRVADGTFNMADPRCYLRAGASACRPGDPFPVADRVDMMAFAAHRPLPWQAPPWQRVARVVTLASLGLSLLAMIALGLCRCISRWSRVARGNEPRATSAVPGR